MVKLSSKYGSNHPKDRAARRMQEFMRSTREQGCTHKELWRPTEANIRKCQREMQGNAAVGEQFKKDAKFLGESSNVDKIRRNR